MAAVTLIGAASGLRSQLGVAAVTLTRADRAARPGRMRTATTAKILTSTLAAIELVLDKWPGAPSRLRAPALTVRMAAGGYSSAVLAARASARESAPQGRHDRRTSCYAGGTGAAAALAAAYAGAAWRARAARGRRSAWAAALIEDGAAVALAAGACGVARSRAVAAAENT